MLYFILRPLTRIALKAYFRRITINGLENLPKDKPVLLCSNHPAGFIEPCLMACFLPRILHFLVRGDLFEKPILGKILVSTKQIPIYRFRDGFGKLRNNRKVMNISYDKLAEGKAILIFPEASTIETKHLRPIKKGAARMALETLALHPDIDLSILPVGINYSSPNRWRSYVNINIGKPIVPELPEDMKDLPKEILGLTKEIDRELRKQLLVLNEGVRVEDLDLLLDIGQWHKSPKTSLTARYDEVDRFEYERRLSVNLDKEINKEVLSEAGPDFHRFSKEGVGIVEWLISILIVVPVFFALTINALPVVIGLAIRNKYVSINEFIGAIAIAASLGVYMIVFVITFVLVFLFYSWWAFLLFLLPFLGLLGLMGFDFLRDVWHRAKLRRVLGEESQTRIFDCGSTIIKEVFNEK